MVPLPYFLQKKYFIDFHSFAFFSLWISCSLFWNCPFENLVIPVRMAAFRDVGYSSCRRPYRRHPGPGFLPYPGFDMADSSIYQIGGCQLSSPRNGTDRSFSSTWDTKTAGATIISFQELVIQKLHHCFGESSLRFNGAASCLLFYSGRRSVNRPKSIILHSPDGLLYADISGLKIVTVSTRKRNADSDDEDNREGPAVVTYLQW